MSDPSADPSDDPSQESLAPWFSALDPSRDVARWERAIGDVVARARRGLSFAGALVGTGRYVLALAAAASLLVWLPSATRSVPRATPLSRWVAGQDVAPLDLLQLGNDHE